MTPFKDSLTKEQKAIILSTMKIIADADGNYSTAEDRQIAKTATLLNINYADPLIEQTRFYVLEERLKILHSLNFTNKVFFTIVLDNLLKSSPRVTTTKLQYVIGVLEDIGISEKSYLEIVKK